MDFYKLLYNNQVEERGYRAASMVFDQAVAKLRARYVGQPLVWAPFNHIGA